MVHSFVDSLVNTVMINILHYCPVAIMAKFVQLADFHWLRISLQWANIFWYSLSSRKMEDLFVNTGEWKERK